MGPTGHQHAVSDEEMLEGWGERADGGGVLVMFLVVWPFQLLLLSLSTFADPPGRSALSHWLVGSERIQYTQLWMKEETAAFSSEIII